MFVDSGTYPEEVVPICEYARAAVIRALREADVRTRVLEILGGFSATRWYAFELAFLTAFQLSGGLMVVNAIGLDGALAHRFTEPGQKIRIFAGHVVHLERTNKLLGPLQSGSMIICYDGFPVIDFFVYTSEMKYFIQVSRQSYSHHRSKYADLFTVKMIEGLSVFEYFSGLCGVHTSEQRRQRLPEDWMYIFVTDLPKSSSTMEVNEHNEDVILVTRDELRTTGNFPEFLFE